MASDNRKLEVWSTAYEAWLEIHFKPADAAKHADEALALMEQREREGRFGPPSDQGSFTLHAAKMGEDLQHWHDHAAKAEAEVERLKAELEAAKGGQSLFAKALADESERADKAESLLKEALRLMRASVDWCGQYAKDVGADEYRAPWVHPANSLLARARQEGFSDGE